MTTQPGPPPPIFVAIEFEVLARLHPNGGVAVERQGWAKQLMELRQKVAGVGLWSNIPFGHMRQVMYQQGLPAEQFNFYGSGKSWFRSGENGTEVKVFETVSKHVKHRWGLTAPLSEESFLLIDTKENASRAGLLPNTIVLDLVQANDQNAANVLERLIEHITRIVLHEYNSGLPSVRRILEKIPFIFVPEFIPLPPPEMKLWQRVDDKRRHCVVVVDASFFMMISTTPSPIPLAPGDDRFVHTRKEFDLFFGSLVSECYVLVRSSSFSRSAIVKALASLGSVVVGRDIAYICGCDDNQERSDDQAWMTDVHRHPDTVAEMMGPTTTQPKGKMLPNLVNYLSGSSRYPEMKERPIVPFALVPTNIILVDPAPIPEEAKNCIICERFSTAPQLTPPPTNQFGQPQHNSNVVVTTQSVLFVVRAFDHTVPQQANVVPTIDHIVKSAQNVSLPQIPNHYTSINSAGVMATTMANSMFRLVYDRCGPIEHPNNKGLLDPSTLKNAVKEILECYQAEPINPNILAELYDRGNGHFEDVGPYFNKFGVRRGQTSHPFKWLVNSLLLTDNKALLMKAVPLIKSLNNRIRHYSKLNQYGQHVHPSFNSPKVLYFGWYVTDLKVSAAQSLLKPFGDYCRVVPIITASRKISDALEMLKHPGEGEGWIVEIHVPARATMLTYYEPDEEHWIFSPYTLFKMTFDPEATPEPKIILQAHNDNRLDASNWVPCIDWLGV